MYKVLGRLYLLWSVLYPYRKDKAKARAKIKAKARVITCETDFPSLVDLYFSSSSRSNGLACRHTICGTVSQSNWQPSVAQWLTAVPSAP